MCKWNESKTEGLPHSHSFSPSTLNILRVKPLLSAFTVSSSSSPSASSSSSASRSFSSSSSELDSPSSSSFSPHSSPSSFLPCRAMISAKSGWDSHLSGEMKMTHQILAAYQNEGWWLKTNLCVTLALRIFWWKQAETESPVVG